MRYGDLSWNGTRASDLGVMVSEQVNYKRPALRRSTVTVPGRSGVLTVKEAEAWECVTYAPGLLIRPGADREAVYRWLRGSGRVVFGSMPDDAFDAVIVSQIDTTEIVPGHPAGYTSLVVVFECQPWRYPVVEASDIQLTTEADYAQERLNPGNVPSAPLITAEVTPETVLTLTVSGCEPVVIETPAGDTETVNVIIDCDAQTAYTADGVLLDSVMVGEFPMIPVGMWTITASGENGTVCSVTVQPRWRSV